ncbi:MAG: PfkB family carbohydrate kinase [bacterium]
MPAGVRVLCVGEVMTDVVATLPGPLARGSDTPASVRTRPGGSAANTAAWLAFLGTSATLVARVGADPFGVAAAEDLRRRGVAAELAVDPVRPTGICLVLVDPDGERTMVPDAGANAALTAADLPAEHFVEPTRLHLSAYLLFSPARPAAAAALALARARGLPISVDASSAAPLAAVGPSAFFELIGPDVLLLANEDEAAVLTGQTDPEAAAHILAERSGCAVVKRGAGGALWSDGTSVITAAATPARVIDTTGAGDAFAAALLSGLARGQDPGEALAAGHALAATACGLVGGRPPG